MFKQSLFYLIMSQSPHFISLCRHFTISHCHKKGECSTVIYLERDHIHITFITGYCYNCSILLLVIVVNLLLGLIYKLNFIIGICIRKKQCIQSSVFSAVSSVYWGSWNVFPWIREDNCTRKMTAFSPCLVSSMLSGFYCFLQPLWYQCTRMPIIIITMAGFRAFEGTIQTCFHTDSQDERHQPQLSLLQRQESGHSRGQIAITVALVI